MHSKEFTLQVGVLRMKLYTSEDSFIYIPEGFEPFLSANNVTPNVEIEVVQKLPFNSAEGLEVFRAEDFETSQNATPGGLLWHIIEKNEKRFVFTSEPYRGLYPYLAASFDDNLKKWTLYNSEIAEDKGVSLMNPLAYPMGPLLLYHLALNNNAIMIHASGVITPEGAYIFSGFSGVGKSTMAGLWQEKEYTIINDDRLLLYQHQGVWHACNTPMGYTDTPRSAPLKAAFLLKQHPENYLTLLSGIHATTRMMAFCIQHHYDPRHIQMLTDTIFEASDNIDIYELGFKPDTRVVDMVVSNRSKT